MNYTGKMDEECVDLCNAINKCAGITTIESCCGHSKQPYRVWFRAEALEDLPTACYFFDVCHCGFSGWRVIATTDCSMRPVTFRIEGPSTGSTREAKDIAELIEDHLGDAA